ncbi:DUF167 domain-containing protein [Thiotrichales bacterium 19S11-10]|nr:DUF167 domain-containing protein [Thiotrichales bacterium 19S11-10]MCF6808585.1 DUF167 domain-containing protein [Thiotrichales bacterium 19S9-11]MCF6812555.1 DUF167 domain-containing protein [Thiotrichales bacterium 19S9-12]
MNTLLEVYVQPGSKTTELSGKHDGRIKIRLKSSPIDGKANQELITFMAQLLKVKKQDIQIVRGEKSRLKLLSIPKNSNLIKQLKTLDIE